MTPSVAISARGVGKRYRLGTTRKSGLSRLTSWLPRSGSADEQAFWALKDATFDIGHGENVGLIGLNGAGKSTMLKILSRITRPSAGRVSVDGRIGALLEVGTGFHGDLTGRENVYLYGSILGMTREEVRRKFDAIIDFSGTAAFVDTPVKRYSSGMYVRLAFAVAAHLEPEILLLDEVLAVGDLPFQRKCMEFAKGMQQRNATILFVSHNMFSIKTMCERVIYLRKGQIVFDGPTVDGIRLYEEDCRTTPQLLGTSRPLVRLTKCTVTDASGVEKAVVRHGESVKVRLEYETDGPVKSPNFIVAFMRADDVACCNYSSVDDGVDLGIVNGKGVLELQTPPLRLVAEQYNLFILVRVDGFGEIVGSHGPVPLHVSHDLYDTHFGVFHEPATWRTRGFESESREAPVASST